MKMTSKVLLVLGLLTGAAHAQVSLIGSQLQVTGPATLNTQGAYLGWNRATLGETDFENIQGVGAGGYCWFNTSAHTQLMCVTSTGALTVLGVVSSPNMLVNGNNTLVSAQGLNLAWNESGGSGESDFVNQFQSGGTGGFNWYNTGTSGSHGSPIMTLSQTGPTLTVAQIVSTLTGNSAGTHTGANVGNSSTATALAATPTPCTGAALAGGVNASGNSVGCATNIATASALAATPSQCSGVPTSGIAANGNANCFASTYKMESMIITSGICTTSSAAGNSCSFTSPAWASAFADTGYSVTCTVAPPTGGSAAALQVYISGKTTTFFAVTLQNGQGSAAVATTTAEIDCIGIHI